MPELRFSLTKEGHKSMLTKGVYNTFRNYTVSDKNLRYDIDVDPILSETFYGGTRTIVTDGKCKMASAKAITKEAPSDEEKKLEPRNKRITRRKSLKKKYNKNIQKKKIYEKPKSTNIKAKKRKLGLSKVDNRAKFLDEKLVYKIINEK